MSEQVEEFACDAAGNPYSPSDCPCCQGELRFDPMDLCDACLAAGLVDQHPHGCGRGGEK